MVFVLCALPLAWLTARAFGFAGLSLGPNPIEALLHGLGSWGLRLLLVTSGGELTLENLRLTDAGTDGSGGALAVAADAEAALKHCTFADNFAYERGGAIYGRLWPRNDEERKAAEDAGYDLDRVLTTEDLVSGDDVFFAATGITDGDLLRGVRYWGNGARTQSLVMLSKSGTIRTIESTHKWQKLMRYSAFKFD